MSELRIREIETFDDALDIAVVRNTGCEFLTGNPNEITVPDQVHWFANVYRPHNRFGRMRAYVGRVDGNAVAYGLLNHKTADWWVTGVITPEQRGKGYGEELFRHMGEVAFGDIGLERLLLDVRDDNEPAIKLYEKLGYEAVLHGSGITIMELDRPYEPIAA